MDNGITSSAELLASGSVPDALERFLDAPEGVLRPSGQSELKATGFYKYWRILSIYKKTIFWFALIGFLLGLLLTFLEKPTYRAKTAIEILNINQDFFYNKQTSPLSDSDPSSDTSDLQTQVRILSSDALLDRVRSELNPEQNRDLLRPGTPKKTLDLAARDELLETAGKSVKVRAVGRTRVIEISVDSVDRNLATDYANTLTSEFIKENLDSRWKATEKTNEWLGHEIESTRNNLQKSENALQAYARNSGILFTNDNTNVSEEKLSQVQQELSAATADRIAKQSRFELARTASPDTVPEVANSKELADARAKIVDLERQSAELSTTYTPDYIKVKRLQAEIASLEAAFAKARSTIVSRIENDYQEAIRREKLLQAAYFAQTRDVTDQGEKSIQYGVLKREVQSNRQLYDNMLQQFNESHIASAMRASNVRVLEPASLPRRPNSPDIRIDGGVGLLLGLLLGVIYVVLRKQANRTIQEPGELQLWSTLPELGVVPTVLKSQATFQRSPKSLGSPSGSEPLDRLARRTGNQTLIAEAFRAIGTSLLFSEAGSQSRVLVVTSAHPSEGKTTVVSNLARALADIRKTVLVIDADLRRPQIHRFFGLTNELGLSNLLSESFHWGDHPAGYIQESSVRFLDVLTSGPSTDDPGIELHSPGFARLIARMRLKYDIILIDTPPMLQMSDARIVARWSDGVILVARAEQTPREAIMGANDQLVRDRIRVLGTILNDWDPSKSVDGHHGYRGSAYYKAYERYKTVR